MKNFRTETFNLCKILSKRDDFENLRATLRNLLTKKDGEIKDEVKMDIASNGIKLNCEFFGILLAFSKQLSAFPVKQQNNLSGEEQKEILFGHYIISRFIMLCLSDIESKNKSVAKLLNPYTFFDFNIDFEEEYSFDLSILNDAVYSFKHTKIYLDIIKSNILNLLNDVPQETLYNLFGIMERDIIKIPLNKVSDDVFALKMRELTSKQTKQINKIDALSIISFKLIALREMLKIACHLIYSSILNCPLNVVNDENLIKIDKDESNVIYSYKTILIQGAFLNYAKELVGDIVLLDIDLGYSKIHEFGLVRSMTFSFGNDFGETTKLSYCKLDEDLNPISNLTS